MGNSAAKASLDQVQLVECDIHNGSVDNEGDGDNGDNNSNATIHSLSPSLVTTTGPIQLRGHMKMGGLRGYEYQYANDSEQNDAVAFHSTSLAMGKRAVCYDQSGNIVALIQVKGSGSMSGHHDEHHVFRPTPSYPNQTAAPLLEQHDGSLGELLNGVPLYHFAKIQIQREGLRGKAESRYYVCVGHESDMEPTYVECYRAEKTPSMKYYATVYALKRQMQGNVPMGVSALPVGKMSDGGFFTRKGPRTDVVLSKGCDLGAVLLAGQALTPTGNFAGAMAGAGVY